MQDITGFWKHNPEPRHWVQPPRPLPDLSPGPSCPLQVCRKGKCWRLTFTCSEVSLSLSLPCLFGWWKVFLVLKKTIKTSHQSLPLLFWCVGRESVKGSLSLLLWFYFHFYCLFWLVKRTMGKWKRLTFTAVLLPISLWFHFHLWCDLFFAFLVLFWLVSKMDFVWTNKKEVPEADFFFGTMNADKS